MEFEVFCVRTEEGTQKDVQARITEMDREAFFDPESSPTSFWVLTELAEHMIDRLDSVITSVHSDSDELQAMLIMKKYGGKLEVLGDMLKLMHTTLSLPAREILDDIVEVWDKVGSGYVQHTLMEGLISVYKKTKEQTAAFSHQAPAVATTTKC